MSKFRLIVWSLNWVVALASGFIGILWYIDSKELEWLERAREHQFLGLLLFVFALTTVLVNVTYVVVRHVQGYPTRTQVPVKGDSSNVSVSLQALQNALKRALETQPEVHSIEIELDYDGRSRRVTQVRAHGTIWDGPDILPTTLKIQKVLERRFGEIVEPDEPPQFEVQLDSFRFLKEDRRGFRDRIDSIRESFRGPQYPIGG